MTCYFYLWLIITHLYPLRTPPACKHDQNTYLDLFVSNSPIKHIHCMLLSGLGSHEEVAEWKMGCFQAFGRKSVNNAQSRRRMVCRLSVSKEEKRKTEICGFPQSGKPQRGPLVKSQTRRDHCFLFHTSFLPTITHTPIFSFLPVLYKWTPSDICSTCICGRFAINHRAKINEVESFTLWWSIKLVQVT